MESLINDKRIESPNSFIALVGILLFLVVIGNVRALACVHQILIYLFFLLFQLWR